MKLLRSATARFVFDNSLLLLTGTLAAVVWANTDFSTYDAVAHPLHFWVNDIGMVFFFALAAKEVFEATLPGGSLSSPRRALSPLAAAVGGMAAPAVIYSAWLQRSGQENCFAGGPSHARPTSRFRRWSLASSFRQDIQLFLSCCCWRSPTTHSG
jgi:Na+/H+ antiporter NhaA